MFFLFLLKRRARAALNRTHSESISPGVSRSCDTIEASSLARHDDAFDSTALWEFRPGLHILRGTVPGHLSRSGEGSGVDLDG